MATALVIPSLPMLCSSRYETRRLPIPERAAVSRDLVTSSCERCSILHDDPVQVEMLAVELSHRCNSIPSSDQTPPSDRNRARRTSQTGRSLCRRWFKSCAASRRTNSSTVLPSAYLVYP